MTTANRKVVERWLPLTPFTTERRVPGASLFDSPVCQRTGAQSTHQSPHVSRCSVESMRASWVAEKNEEYINSFPGLENHPGRHEIC